MAQILQAMANHQTQQVLFTFYLAQVERQAAMARQQIQVVLVAELLLQVAMAAALLALPH